MKPNRWMIAAAAVLFAACAETPTEQMEQSRQFAAVGEVDCVTCDGTYTKATLVIPGGRSIVLGQTLFVGVAMAVEPGTFEASTSGKATFWSSRGAVGPSDTFPPGPGPGPSTPIRSIVQKSNMHAFLSLLNAAGGVSPSDTFPPGPGPVGAVWRNEAGQVTRVLYVASIDQMTKAGTIVAGDTNFNMLLDKRLEGSGRFFTNAVSIIGPERSVPATKK